MGFMENVIDEYYLYSKWILGISNFIFVAIILIGVYIFRENLRYICVKLVYKFIYSTIISIIGELLCLAGLALEIEYVYFNVTAFLFIAGGILIYGILLGLMFKQIILPMMQCYQYMQIAVCLELFLLAATRHLEPLEWFAGTCGVIAMEMSVLLLTKLLETQKQKKIKEKNKADGYPNSDLFPTRQKQLEKFISLLEHLEQEPYAIMISGEWGSGKTSFVKKLEEKLETKNFIWVNAGSEKTVTEIMSEISAEIVDILRKNNVFLEHKDLIEKYFLAFSDLFDDTALKPLRKISTVFINGKGIDDRDYLNDKLDCLNKTIYLIIDDLDRCDEEYQAKMFKVIRESMELHHCKTVFLVDKNKFLKERKDTEYIEKYGPDYLEKYVSYTLDLCEVEYQEIIEYFIEDIWQDAFIRGMKAVLLKNRNVKQIREMIIGFPYNLIERLENEIAKEMNLLQNKKNEELLKGKEKINEIQRAISQVKKDITISRKVLNYLKGIKRNVEALNEGIETISGEFSKEDWFRSIIAVQYLKNFMPEIYNEIKMHRDIFEFFQKYKGYVVDEVFDLKYRLILHEEKKEAILNRIIYKIDVIDFSDVQTNDEKYLSELRSDEYVTEHIGEYIRIAQSYDNLKKILQIYAGGEWDNSGKENFIEMLFETLTQQSSHFKADTEDFLIFSKQLIDCLLKKGLSDKGKTLCVRKGSLVIRRAIMDNARLFINVLSIIFPVNVVYNGWRTLPVSNIDEFYNVLEIINKESGYKGLEDEVNKLLSIKTYFWNLEVKLRNEKYHRIKSQINELFSTIKIIFSICEFWDDIEYTINDREKDEYSLVLKKYFILEEGYRLREKALIDVFDLLEALQTLKLFYSSKERHYESDYYLPLLTLANRAVVQYEETPQWLGNKKKEVAKLLLELAELVCKRDKSSGHYEKDTIMKISIYAYKFNTYYEKDEIKRRKEKIQQKHPVCQR